MAPVPEPQNPYAPPQRPDDAESGPGVKAAQLVRVLGSLFLIVPGCALATGGLAGVVDRVVGSESGGFVQLTGITGWGIAWVAAGVAYWRGNHVAAGAWVGLGAVFELALCSGSLL